MSGLKHTAIKLLFMLPMRRYISGDVPLGICSVIAYLKKEFGNIDVTLLDGNLIGAQADLFRKNISAEVFDIAGVFFDTLSYARAKELVGLAREKAKITIAGGPHATAVPESLFSLKGLDVIVPGEAEYKIKHLINAFKQGKSLLSVPGVFAMSNGQFVFTGESKELVDMISLPIPDRSYLNMPFYLKRLTYFDLLGIPVRGTSISASRGCSFRCTYCQSLLDKHFGAGVRYRAPKDVVAEIEDLHHRYAANAIFFHDDNITVNKKWVLEFCDLLTASKLNIVWGCNSRVDTFTPEIAEKMAKAGLKKLHFGIESGSQRVLSQIYKKGTRLEQVKPAIEAAHRNNIYALGFFMLGAPTETKDEIRQTIKLARECNLDEVTFSIFTPLPGSDLWDRFKDKMIECKINYGDLNYYSKAVISASDGINCKEIRRMQILAFFMFYLHPKRMAYILRHCKSFMGMGKLLIKIKRVLGID